MGKGDEKPKPGPVPKIIKLQNAERNVPRAGGISCIESEIQAAINTVNHEFGTNYREPCDIMTSDRQEHMEYYSAIVGIGD